MHSYVHSGTVCNSKDLEPIQMPINDRLDNDNAAHIHHGIVCSHRKQYVCVLYRDMMDLETIILSKLTQEQKIKHCMFSLTGGYWIMRTHERREVSITHQCLLWGVGEGQQWVGSWGGLTWREMPDVGEVEEGSKSHCHVCTYATILHVLHMYPKT